MGTILLLLLCLPLMARAEGDDLSSSTDSPDPFAAFSSMTLAASGVVDQVIDPLTLHLDSGQIVRLMGVDIPEYAAAPPPVHARAAMTAMVTEFRGERVNVYQPRTQVQVTTPYGQMLGYVVRTADGKWGQDMLLASGHARVWDGFGSGVDFTPLLEIEQDARSLRSGLWQDGGAYTTFAPPQIKVTAVGDLIVLNAVVSDVQAVDNNILIGLTEAGRNGLHLHIPVKVRAALSREGFDAFDLRGKLIRARGILALRGGVPVIDISARWQIEEIPQNLLGPAP